MKGETNTYEDARPLLEDFFKTLDARIAGSSTAVVYRFAHGETTMPFAALIKAPGSDVQVPEGERFTRGRATRGAERSPDDSPATSSGPRTATTRARSW